MRVTQLLSATLLVAVPCLEACGSCSDSHDVVALDAGEDGGTRDGGADAGARDGGANDAGARDGGANDSGAPDGGARDGAVPDDAAVDGSPGDAGADAGALDGGSDGGPACTVEPETCNGLDDDCDGRSDEGLLAMAPGDTRAWPMPDGETLASTQRAFAQLLPHAGGALLLTKPLAPSDGASPLTVTQLGADGAPLGAGTEILRDSRNFLAALDGDLLAVLWRDTDADDDTSVDDLATATTTLSLFQLDGTGAPMELDSLAVGGPSDIAELALTRTAGGELRLLAAYAPWRIAGNAGTLEPTVVHALRYEATGAGLSSLSTTSLPSDARPTVHALPRPCGSGWLVAYWQRPDANDPSTRQLSVRAMTLGGSLDLDGAPLFALTGSGLQGFAAAPTCDAASSPLLLLADAADARVEAHELAFAHATSDLAEVAATEVVGAFAFSHVARYGGQWFATLRNFGDAPTGVFELDVPGGTVRDLAPPVAQGGLSGLNPPVDVNMYFIPTHGIVAVDGGLLVTFSNARPSDSPMGPSTVALTHRLACPSM